MLYIYIYYIFIYINIILTNPILYYEYKGLKRKKKAQEAQPGRAELWRCLGYKFKSYLGQNIIYINYNK